MALSPITIGMSGTDALTNINAGFTQIDANVTAIAGKVTSGGALGTPTSGTATNITGLPISTGVSGLGTGVATALAVAVGSVGAALVNGGALGTPSSGTLTSCTGLPAAGVVGTAAILGANTFTGQQIVSTNGAASTPPVSLTGTVFTGGSTTTTKPQFLIEPTGTTSTGWSTSGTGLGVNVPSGFSGHMASFQKEGVAEFTVDSGSGGFCRTRNSLQFGVGAVNSCGIAVHNTDNLLFNSDNEYVMKLYNTQLILQSTCQFNISSGDAYSGSADVGFARTSAGVARISNGATGRATLDALGYQVGGVAGANFGPASPTSITVVNGIITAIS